METGPGDSWAGPYFVSTTRFTFEAYGARARTTYTISVWRDEADLNRWVRSVDHAPLMRAFRPRQISSAIVSWETDKFELRSAWREALKKLA